MTHVVTIEERLGEEAMLCRGVAEEEELDGLCGMVAGLGCLRPTTAGGLEGVAALLRA